MLFNFFATKQPEAGAEAYAFQSAFANPAFNLYRGPGCPYYGVINAWQPPQVYFAGGTTTLQGLGGLIFNAGYLAPLIDNR